MINESSAVRLRRRRRGLVSWPVACGIVALAVAPWLIARDPLADLVQAASELRLRPVRARLFGFDYGAAPLRVRDAALVSLPIRLRMAVDDVLLSVSTSSRPQDLHAAGVAALVTGDRSAVDKFRTAAERSPDVAYYWNDLAVALHARADFEDNPHELLDALVAVDRTLRLEPGRGDALFNRGLILEAMNLKSHADTAWKAYLQVDSSSSWADEARRYLHSTAEESNPETPPHNFRQTTRGDLSILKPAVLRDPENARRFAESPILASWARAELKGDAHEAEAWLEDARVIGDVLRDHNGESLLREAVTAITQCTGACRKGLAAAHVRYDEARIIYRDRRVREALEAFRVTAGMFRRTGTPMAFLADYYALNCLEDLGDEAVLAHLEPLRAAVPRRYRALQAQIFGLMATNRGRLGRPAAALDFARQALVEFERLGERSNAIRLREDVAAYESLLGRPVRAWRLRVASFGDSWKSLPPDALQRSLELAGRMEAAEEHWDAARVLFSLAADSGTNMNPRIHTSGLLWSALAAERASDHADAEHRLARARIAATRIPEAALRDAALDDLSFAEVSIVLATDSQRAAAVLDHYLASKSQGKGRTFLLADAFLLRARAARALGDFENAEHFYRSAIAAASTRRESVIAGAVADVYFATESAAVHELTHLLVSRGRAADAFSVLDRGRSRALTRQIASSADDVPALADIQHALPAATMVVSYLVLPEETVTFTLTRRGGLEVMKSPAGARVLSPLIEQFREAIVRGDDDVADSLSERLDEILLAPIRPRFHGIEEFLVIDDPITHDVPFAALRERNGRRLVERMRVASTLSTQAFVRPFTGKDLTRRAFVAGDPALDRSRYPELGSLPSARREAAAIARLYPNAELWIGEHATAERFLEAIGSARVIHVAAHAIANRNASIESALLLSGTEKRSGIVFAEEILQSSCVAEVVVLAGCRTAVASETPSDIRGLASAFLVAGAQNVVGTLWSVDDGDASVFSRHFHEQLVRGIAPSEAMRNVQLRMLGGPLRSWSGFTLTTAGN